MRSAPIALTALSALLMSACGYSLAGRGATLPQHIQRVGIPPFENQTSRLELDEILTSEVQQQFIAHGGYDVVSQRDGVDALLLGEITNFSSRPVALDAEGRATQISVLINSRVQFRDLVANKILFSSRNFVFRKEYQVASDAANYFDQEIEAIREASTDFAATLASSILEGF
ncbi:MAG TPA: LPS assembly lipoprotein LptE [Acidobacteriota bacterium]